MSPIYRVSIAAVVTVLIGTISLLSCNTLAESFYAVLPASVLIYWLTGAATFRDAWQSYLRPTLVVALGLFAGGIGAAHLVLGWNAIGHANVWREVAASLYFGAGVVLVLLGVRRVLLACARRLQARWQLAPAPARLVGEVIPLLVFVLFAVPYSLAIAQVHRFKMPNLVDPQMIRGRDFQEIAFNSADGTRLRGWWIPAPTGKSERTLIICHGLAGNRSMFLPFVEVGDWLEANVLMLDMRGCGDSAGRTVTMGYREKDDILAAIIWARRERPDETRELIGLGISMGAAALAQAAPQADPPLDAIILDSPFASTRAMSASAMQGFPEFCHPWLTLLGFPLADWHADCPMTQVAPEADIARVRTPVLFFHCKGDWLIPSEHSVRMHGLTNAPKRLCVFELPGHADALFFERDRYRSEVAEFWSSVRAGVRER